MDESPQSRKTLRQALSGQWQIPLFLVVLAAFVTVLLQLRPERPKRSFEERYAELELLAESNRYYDFYEQAEELRQASEDEGQLGWMHGLAAQVRSRELRGRHEFGVETMDRRSAAVNYETIIQDYSEALARGWIEPESEAHVEVFYDMGLAYWGLNEADKAIKSLKQAISFEESVRPGVYRDLVGMYLSSRPKGYLDSSLSLLERMLGESSLVVEDRGWSFVHKAEVLLAQGLESDALEFLMGADESIRSSHYGLEMEFYRGRAMRNGGQADEAELILRDLLGRLTSRGDIYAQTALELGKINYEQYRDHDARDFYERVVSTQPGKDWYVAGKLGLAQCAAMQQRDDEAIELFGEAVQLLKRSPYNRAVRLSEVQESLAMLSEQLGLERKYGLALRYIEIEKEVVRQDDLRAVNRFAVMHERMAKQLLDRLREVQVGVRELAESDSEREWVSEQKELIKGHYVISAEGYLHLAKLGITEDDLYGLSLWKAASNYDKAGDVEHAIEVWQRVVKEREGKRRWPMGVFNLAQSYRSVGSFDRAVEYYQILREKYPRSPAALGSAVPLAKCYLSKEPSEPERAEWLLREVLKDRALTPLAPAYREALFVLGDLHYDGGQFPQAINVFTEAIDRYPLDSQLGKAMFLVGDSYRKSGLALDQALANLSLDPTAVVLEAETSGLRRNYLDQGRDYFSRAIRFYEGIPEGRLSRLDKLYLRHCWLYRADCLFDLGRYAESVLAYEETALRYQLTPTALASFVQIINAQVRLGRHQEAKSAKERAVWQLRKMPDEAFGDVPYQFSRQEWQGRFDWLDRSGFW